MAQGHQHDTRFQRRLAQNVPTALNNVNEDENIVTSSSSSAVLSDELGAASAPGLLNNNEQSSSDDIHLAPVAAQNPWVRGAGGNRRVARGQYRNVNSRTLTRRVVEQEIQCSTPHEIHQIDVDDLRLGQNRTDDHIHQLTREVQEIPRQETNEFAEVSTIDNARRIDALQEKTDHIQREINVHTRQIHNLRWQHNDMVGSLHRNEEQTQNKVRQVNQRIDEIQDRVAIIVDEQGQIHTEHNCTRGQINNLFEDINELNERLEQVQPEELLNQLNERLANIRPADFSIELSSTPLEISDSDSTNMDQRQNNRGPVGQFHDYNPGLRNRGVNNNDFACAQPYYNERRVEGKYQMLPRLQPYEGRVSELEDFLDEYESLATAMHWDDAKKISLLPAHVNNDLRQALMRLPRRGEEPWNAYRDRVLLTQQIDIQENRHKKFVSCKQRPDEEVHTYINRFRTAMNRYFGENAQHFRAMIMKQFVLGLLPPIREGVKFHTAANFDEFAEYTRQMATRIDETPTWHGPTQIAAVATAPILVRPDVTNRSNSPWRNPSRSPSPGYQSYNQPQRSSSQERNNYNQSQQDYRNDQRNPSYQGVNRGYNDDRQRNNSRNDRSQDSSRDRIDNLNRFPSRERYNDNRYPSERGRYDNRNSQSERGRYDNRNSQGERGRFGNRNDQIFSNYNRRDDSRTRYPYSRQDGPRNSYPGDRRNDSRDRFNNYRRNDSRDRDNRRDDSRDRYNRRDNSRERYNDSRPRDYGGRRDYTPPRREFDRYNRNPSPYPQGDRNRTPSPGTRYNSDRYSQQPNNSPRNNDFSNNRNNSPFRNDRNPTPERPKYPNERRTESVIPPYSNSVKPKENSSDNRKGSNEERNNSPRRSVTFNEQTRSAFSSILTPETVTEQRPIIAESLSDFTVHERPFITRGYLDKTERKIPEIQHNVLPYLLWPERKEIKKFLITFIAIEKINNRNQESEIHQIRIEDGDGNLVLELENIHLEKEKCMEILRQVLCGKIIVGTELPWLFRQIQLRETDIFGTFDLENNYNQPDDQWKREGTLSQQLMQLRQEYKMKLKRQGTPYYIFPSRPIYNEIERRSEGIICNTTLIPEVQLRSLDVDIINDWNELFTDKQTNRVEFEDLAEQGLICIEGIDKVYKRKSNIRIKRNDPPCAIITSHGEVRLQTKNKSVIISKGTLIHPKYPYEVDYQIQPINHCSLYLIQLLQETPLISLDKPINQNSEIILAGRCITNGEQKGITQITAKNLYGETVLNIHVYPNMPDITKYTEYSRRFTPQRQESVSEFMNEYLIGKTIIGRQLPLLLDVLKINPTNLTAVYDLEQTNRNYMSGFISWP